MTFNSKFEKNTSYLRQNLKVHNIFTKIIFIFHLNKFEKKTPNLRENS